MHEITQILKDHYSKTFALFGATPKGVDWGKPEDVELRYANMLAVIEDRNQKCSLLDVGCGYGGLFEYMGKTGKSKAIDYTGIDVCAAMINDGKKKYQAQGAQLRVQDIFKCDQAHDYVVCSGILTQKLTASTLDMNAYANALIKYMFNICHKGIAFNIMTTHCNFFAPNLYYRCPLDTFAFCTNELSRKVAIDHSYRLYEYTVYVYKEGAVG